MVTTHWVFHKFVVKYLNILAYSILAFKYFFSARKTDQ